MRNTLKKVDLNFIKSIYPSGKIPLKVIYIDEDEKYFTLRPIDIYEIEYDCGFESVLALLLTKLNYKGNIDHNEFYRNIDCYDKYSGNPIPFLVDLDDDFYLHGIKKNIDFEIMEDTHEWLLGGRLNKKEISKLISEYNSKSKYFEIVSYSYDDEV